MFYLYQKTDLEKKIEKVYLDNDIISPIDLTIEKVSKAFGAHVSYDFEEGPQHAMWNNEESVIFLRSNQPVIQKREIFFHELGHPFLHVGDQSGMNNDSFRLYQESQANQFQMYSAVPFFMLEKLPIPEFEFEAIQLIQKVFKVSNSLAKKRYNQIKSKILQAQMDQALYVAESLYADYPSPTVEDLFSENDIKEMHLHVEPHQYPTLYINEVNGVQMPVWYVLDARNLKWNNKLWYFPIDVPFEVINITEYKEIESDAFVSPAYLSLQALRPDDVAIDTKTLRKMLVTMDVDPYNVTRLIIDAKQLEELLDLKLLDLCKEQTSTAC